MILLKVAKEKGDLPVPEALIVAALFYAGFSQLTDGLYTERFIKNIYLIQKTFVVHVSGSGCVDAFCCA